MSYISVEDDNSRPYCKCVCDRSQCIIGPVKLIVERKSVIHKLYLLNGMRFDIINTIDGLVWCLIVSIPDLCPLSYFVYVS